MATIEKTKKLILEIIDDQGIYDHDAAKYGYATTACAMYAAMAAPILRTVPNTDWNAAEIADQAEIWCERFWKWYHHSKRNDYLPLPLDNGAVKGTNWEGVIRGKSYLYSSRNTYDPSRLRDDPVERGKCSEDEISLIEERLHDLRLHAMGMIRGIGHVVDQRQPISIVQRSDLIMLSVNFVSGVKESVGMRPSQLIHDTLPYLLRELETLSQRVDAGFQKYQGIARRQIEVDKQLDDLPATRDLPVRFRFAPCVKNDDRIMVEVLLDGYGRTGMPAIIRVGLAHAEDNVEETLSRFSGDLAEQRRRHARYGPVPGSVANRDWTIDGPTARRLGDALVEAVVHHMHTGKCLAPNGVSLRAKGNHIMGTVSLTNDIIWKGDRIDIGNVEISAVVAAAAVGRSLNSIVESELFGADTIITNVSDRKVREKRVTTIKVHPDIVKIDGNQISQMLAELYAIAPCDRAI